MLRRWLRRISPEIGRPSGSTTLVGKGLTREVIGQTKAKPVLSVNAAGETTSAWAPAGLLAAERRIEVGPDEVAVGVRQVFRHSSTRSRPRSGPQS